MHTSKGGDLTFSMFKRSASKDRSHKMPERSTEHPEHRNGDPEHSKPLCSALKPSTVATAEQLNILNIKSPSLDVSHAALPIRKGDVIAGLVDICTNQPLYDRRRREAARTLGVSMRDIHLEVRKLVAERNRSRGG